MGKDPLQTVYYLARRGKIDGPFDKDQYQKMQSENELSKYSWIWSQSEGTWKPIDPPPSLTPQGGKIVSHEELQLKRAAKQISVGKLSAKEQKKLSTLLVICHDQRNAISGHLDEIGPGGANLVTQDHSSLPKLGQNGKVLLNLLDSKSGKSINVDAKISSVSKQGHQWTYRLLWKQVPHLVA